MGYMFSFSFFFKKKVIVATDSYIIVKAVGEAYM
jgi:hypothetical protein